jgi:hypothetical protein
MKAKNHTSVIVNNKLKYTNVSKQIALNQKNKFKWKPQPEIASIPFLLAFPAQVQKQQQ